MTLSFLCGLEQLALAWTLNCMSFYATSVISLTYIRHIKKKKEIFTSIA